MPTPYCWTGLTYLSQHPLANAHLPGRPGYLPGRSTGCARVVICRVGPPGAPSPGQTPHTRRDLPGRSAVGDGAVCRVGCCRVGAVRGPDDLPGRRPSTHYLPGRWLCPFGVHAPRRSPLLVISPPHPRPRLPGKTGRTFRREATPSTRQEKRGGRGSLPLRWVRGRT
jgi:hypothetical protein